MQDYTILPRRNGRSDGGFKNIKQKNFATNFYEIDLKVKEGLIYQYDFKLPEQIPANSQIYNRAIHHVKEQLREEIGYLAHKGQMIWGQKDYEKVLTLHPKFQFLGKQYQLQSLITRRKILNTRDIQDAKLQASIVQLMNILLNQCLRNAKMHELGKNGRYFDMSQMTQYQENNVRIIQGYQFTIVPLSQGITVRIDVCSRKLPLMSVLELLTNLKKFEIKQEDIIDGIVMANYGNFKTYKVVGIQRGMNPLSKFYNQKIGQEQNYKEYYEKYYGITVKNESQPLIKIAKKQNKSDKNKKQGQKMEYIYLIPEFVTLVSPSLESLRDNTNQKKSAPVSLKFTPQQRQEKIQLMVNKINQNKQSLIKIRRNIDMRGYGLDQPNIQYKNSRADVVRGIIKTRDTLKQTCNLGQEWLFISNKKNQNKALDAIQLLIQAGKAYGLKFGSPSIQFIKTSSVDAWIQRISGCMKEEGKPKIIVPFLGPEQEKNYGKIKEFITNQIKCPSQFILRKSFDSKNRLSIASKVCIQMNVKLGFAPWSVGVSHKYFSKKNVMYGGISFSKGPKGYTLGFVGTTKNDCTQFYSASHSKIKNKEIVDEAILQQIFIQWAKNYFKNNNRKVPDTIIIYREGLSDKQAEKQLIKNEIPALQNMITKIQKATKTPKYKPEIMIVLVNKGINNRIFEIAQNKLVNPSSGSVIIDDMSINHSYDFHLVPHYVTQGTCTPTLFKVAYDTSKISQEALIEFTYNQCYNYYNWGGAVRVPGCLQSANKISKLVGEHMKQDIVQSQLTKKPFFY